MIEVYISDRKFKHPKEWGIAHIEAAIKLLATEPGNEQQIDELKLEIKRLYVMPG